MEMTGKLQVDNLKAQDNILSREGMELKALRKLFGI
jgi:hypothetical protein